MRHVLTGLLTAATLGFSTLALTGAASAAPFNLAAPALAERGNISALVDQVQFAGPGRPPRVVQRRDNRNVRRGVATAIGVGAAAAIVGGIIASQQRPAYQPEPVYVEPRRYYGEPRRFYNDEPEYVERRPVYVEQRRAYGGRGSYECAQRYRSYNPSTGTYVGFDGIERSCP